MDEALSLIAHMRGSDFLVLYLWCAVITFVICWLCLKCVYRSALGPAFVLPKEVDPYYCTFLRSGPDEVGRLALFELKQKGFLELSAGTLFRVKGQPQETVEAPKISPIPQAILRLCVLPTTLKNFLADSTVKAELSTLCAPFQEAALRDKLIFPDKLKLSSGIIVAAGILFVVALAMFKIAAAFMAGRSNIEFLLILMFIAILSLLLLLSKRPRLTRQGARYMNKLQSPFCGNMRKLDSDAHLDKTLMVGLFGFSLLAGTSLAIMMPYFMNRSFWSYDNGWGTSGGCSGGWGNSSGCSGGSGCGGGGGCGGCGG